MADEKNDKSERRVILEHMTTKHLERAVVEKHMTTRHLEQAVQQQQAPTPKPVSPAAASTEKTPDKK